MSERKVSEATRRVNAFIDGHAPAPNMQTLLTAAGDALYEWSAARFAGNLEAAARAVDAMRNVADVMQDILDGRGQ